jgi:nucleotidyltransferase substrate binding protein (TIGR01987 family)
MEKLLDHRIEEFKSAVKNFENSFDIDTSSFSEIVRDTLDSGRIQKFEFSAELLLKTIKRFLLEKDGVESVSPKSSQKSFFENRYCSYEAYESLIRMIDDRNSLSHIYKSSMALEITKRFQEYLKIMHDLVTVLEKHKNI